MCLFHNWINCARGWDFRSGDWIRHWLSIWEGKTGDVFWRCSRTYSSSAVRHCIWGSAPVHCRYSSKSMICSRRPWRVRRDPSGTPSFFHNAGSRNRIDGCSRSSALVAAATDVLPVVRTRIDESATKNLRSMDCDRSVVGVADYLRLVVRDFVAARICSI
jgi:hypothetical protein